MYYKLFTNHTKAALKRKNIEVDHLGSQLDVPQSLVEGWMLGAPISEQNFSALCGLLEVQEGEIGSRIPLDGIFVDAQSMTGSNATGHTSAGATVNNYSDNVIHIDQFIVSDPDQLKKVMDALRQDQGKE